MVGVKPERNTRKMSPAVLLFVMGFNNPGVFKGIHLLILDIFTQNGRRYCAKKKKVINVLKRKQALEDFI